MASDWVKLEQANDWGYVYYAYEALGDGYASSRREIAWWPGQAVEIQWPNGVVETVRLTSERHSYKVNDMGNEYEVESQIPGFIADIQGVKRFVELGAVKVHPGQWRTRGEGPLPDAAEAEIVPQATDLDRMIVKAWLSEK